jgi:protein-S-isoprenylcysteine O-methyltransferase Ste14
MTTSRSTPRLRLTAALIFTVLGITAVSERSLVTGLAGELMQLAGLVFIACAALGRLWSSLFIAGRKDTSLVREGPYSSMRHPLYALSLLAMLGVGLASRSVWVTLAMVVVFGWIYARAARGEDASIAQVHAAESEAYRREVPGFLPDWSRYRVPESLEIRPRVLWKAFLDAGSILGVYVLLRLADGLQQSGITPTWLELS